MSGSADWVATRKLYVGVRAGYFTNDHTTENVIEQPLFVFMRSNIGYLDVPSALQQAGGFQTDLTNDVSRVDRLSRVNAQVDATYFGSLAGQHMLKAGVQFDRRGNDVDRGQSANQINLFWNAAIAGQRGRYGYYRVLSNPIDPKRGQITFGNVHDNTVGLFVQDAWTVRQPADGQRRPANRKRDGPVLQRDRRAGTSLRSTSRSVTSCATGWSGVGRRGQRPMESPRQLGRVLRHLQAGDAAGRLRRPAIHDLHLQTRDVRLAEPGQQSRLPSCVPGRSGASARAFRPVVRQHRPRSRADADAGATVGLEHQISPHVAVSARFVHKQLDRAVEDIGSVDAEGNATYVIGNPGYHRATEAAPGVPYPKAVRDYDAVELVARKQLDRDWALTASYVWSRLYGNYSGLSESDENGRTDPNIGGTFEAPLALFGGDGRPLYGRLATDRPHQVKAQFIYTAPSGFNVGVFQSVASGLPVSRFAVLAPGISPVFYAGRGSDGRTPALSQTDVSVQYVLAFGGSKRLTVGLNVLNLFNQAKGVSRYSLENDQGVQVDIKEADYYAGRANVSAAFDEQQLPRDPRFLQYQFFQEPIRARVSVRFSF